MFKRLEWKLSSGNDERNDLRLGIIRQKQKQFLQNIGLSNGFGNNDKNQNQKKRKITHYPKNHGEARKSIWRVFEGFIMQQVVMSGLDYMTAKLQDKQGSVLQRFHFQSWRGLTQQQDSSPTGRDDSQDQQLVAAFSFCYLPGLPVTPVIQQNRQTTQATDQEKRKKERRCGSVWQNLRGHKETLQFLSPGAETQDGTWDGREKREKREENRRTLTPHLQLNDSVAVATLARMLCKQPQIVSQDRTRIHARKVLLSAISPVKQLDFRLDFREKEISKK